MSGIVLYYKTIILELVIFSFRLIYLKLDSHRHSGDKAGMRTGGAKDEALQVNKVKEPSTWIKV